MHPAAVIWTVSVASVVHDVIRDLSHRIERLNGWKAGCCVHGVCRVLGRACGCAFLFRAPFTATLVHPTRTLRPLLLIAYKNYSVLVRRTKFATLCDACQISSCPRASAALREISKLYRQDMQCWRRRTESSRRAIYSYICEVS